MIIHGLTVCVNYADFLSIGLKRWMEGLDTLTVVTSPDDEDTLRLITGMERVVPVTTDLFYRDGATFNKGRAMEWARKNHVPWSDWIVFFDADVAPSRGWKQAIERANMNRGFLYSAWRYQCNDPKLIDDQSLPRIVGDALGVGYFQMFHSQDPRANGPLPLLDTHWKHAGNYDNRFMERWPKDIRKPLPIRISHFGPRDNWWGRGKKKEFDEMQAERARKGGRWDHEVISQVQPID